MFGRTKLPCTLSYHMAKALCENAKRLMQIEAGVVEAQTLVKRADGFDLLVCQVEVRDFEVLLQAVDVV